MAEMISSLHVPIQIELFPVDFGGEFPYSFRHIHRVDGRNSGPVGTC